MYAVSYPIKNTMGKLGEKCSLMKPTTQVDSYHPCLQYTGYIKHIDRQRYFLYPERKAEKIKYQMLLSKASLIY